MCLTLFCSEIKVLANYMGILTTTLYKESSLSVCIQMPQVPSDVSENHHLKCPAESLRMRLLTLPLVAVSPDFHKSSLCQSALSFSPYHLLSSPNQSSCFESSCPPVPSLFSSSSSGQYRSLCQHFSREKFDRWLDHRFFYGWVWFMQ